MSLSYQEIQAFLYREARLLDDREWDEWLTCYSKDVEFWMPAWDDDDQLSRDPDSEISLIYYPNREGLEDRVYRIKTERWGASTPEPRTTHLVSNIEVLKEEGDKVELRFNWHTLVHRYKKTLEFFGSSFYTLDVSGEQPQITRKVVQLNNDYIHQVIDIYHI
ncbi:benzoate/toluate 1,2-dioxygenase beta subunit [Halomonas shengliensis]|uniref:Benzoate/toluate 1,2-dioxygenase beta subunit n=1 Tax=Halomonas shengliensis TaxID=419597 RepID=A0A1H0NTT7_9GAMM|nr:benzoate 1,2-dioxygenase small subunit [Halomonas shengliensis]SDO96162.1 benzoate/toluate 1,2-dioxygenase beta subunit [Halomonas shengliensis]